MVLYKTFLILNEGIIFGLFAIGIYVAFQWLRFPDLTPDGSFILGACVFVKAVPFGTPILLCIFLSITSGVLAGFTTAALNKFLRIPSVVAGLLVSISLYSVCWLLLGKPNQFLNPVNTLVGDVIGPLAAITFFIWLLFFLVLTITILAVFAGTIWGHRIRAIGENPLLASDIGISEIVYTFVGLGLANGIVAFAGALFAQRSFSADINMGIGQTIIGLIGMILGLIIARNRRRITVVLTCVVLGSVLHMTVIFFSLEAGMPAESFRLISALFFIALFYAIKTTGIDFLRGLKWS